MTLPGIEVTCNLNHARPTFTPEAANSSTTIFYAGMIFGATIEISAVVQSFPFSYYRNHNFRTPLMDASK